MNKPIMELNTNQPQGQIAPVAIIAVLQFFQEAVNSKVADPLNEIMSNLGRAHEHLPMTLMILQQG